MFDYVHCEYPLPDFPAGERTDDFQTKSLDGLMLTYRIDAEGRLWREVGHIEDRSDPNATDPLEKLIGCMTFVREGWAPVEDACTVFFVTMIRGERFNYKAQFVDGKLHRIERVRE